MLNFSPILWPHSPELQITTRPLAYAINFICGRPNCENPLAHMASKINRYFFKTHSWFDAALCFMPDVIHMFPPEIFKVKMWCVSTFNLYVQNF